MFIVLHGVYMYVPFDYLSFVAIRYKVRYTILESRLFFIQARRTFRTGACVLFEVRRMPSQTSILGSILRLV